eukprot:TRINITY_DN4441_c0_g2_i2.p1 TRINITY_DN4441_c0_g2~~TRINITY_DN4441_c0_g2_i2.p1  ORF type:complete len:121 (+),score=54.52 TRINITY_DN4441_c0_g2_i2:189-551(+)
MEEADRQFIYENYEEAITSYSKLIEAKPNSAELLLCRALAYIESAQYDKAIRDLEEADKHEFNNFQIYLRWGIALFYKGSISKALSELKTAKHLAKEEYETKLVEEWTQKCAKEQEATAA